MVVAPKASRLERNTMVSCFSSSRISTRRNSTGSSPSRASRGKQMIFDGAVGILHGQHSADPVRGYQSETGFQRGFLADVRHRDGAVPPDDANSLVHVADIHAAERV